MAIRIDVKSIASRQFPNVGERSSDFSLDHLEQDLHLGELRRQPRDPHEVWDGRSPNYIQGADGSETIIAHGPAQAMTSRDGINIVIHNGPLNRSIDVTLTNAADSSHPRKARFNRKGERRE